MAECITAVYCALSALLGGASIGAVDPTASATPSFRPSMKSSSFRHRRACYSVWIICALISAVSISGCTRARYRQRADLDTYAILDEKADRTPWRVPNAFRVDPDSRSRFFVPGDPDYPTLPVPAPVIHDYQLPPLPERDPERFRQFNPRPSGPPEQIAPPSEPQVEFPTEPFDDGNIEITPAASLEKPVIEEAAWASVGGNIRPVAYLHQDVETGQDADPGEIPSPDDDVPDELEEGPIQLNLVAIPQDTWADIPIDCLRTMLNSESIREEYLRTFGKEPPPELRDQTTRLTLEDILELSLINSRAYQSARENLYEVALRLTQERYLYALRFAPTGHSTDAVFSNNRTGGTGVNTLAVPTTATVNKALATGGDFVSRFANDVVLTFNGPAGFAADVGSSLLFDLSQSLLQRDIQLEQLTQAERNVVYAARDFARFRRIFFVQQSSRYYSLIQTYRSVEISSQNYFSLIRGFAEAQAEYLETGQRTRIEVDQIEQNALAGRSTLITICTDLQARLDDLKLDIGLPPEMPIGLDLAELDELTLRDEATVNGELVARATRFLANERERMPPSRAVMLNGSIGLVRRLLDLFRTYERLGETVDRLDELRAVQASLSADESRLAVRQNRDELSRELRSEPPAPPLRIYGRTTELIRALCDRTGLIDNLLQVARFRGIPRERINELRTRNSDVRQRLEEMSQMVSFEELEEYVELAQALLVDAEALLIECDELVDFVELTPAEELQQTTEQADRLLEISQAIVLDDRYGLVPIEIDMDEAMLSALVNRFDLMNERGSLADTWRRIKLAGDDLRSVLNLNASHTIRTRANVNRGFDFTFDESTTVASINFDTPVNRRVQRNSYRLSLIDYNFAIRNLIDLEDNIKADIRDDIRELQLGREQYQISVASAALAFERVISTQLQLQLGIEGVVARDFLEAQQAYAVSLNNVASDHINYIQDRNQLFLDLERLYVDENGFWPQLYNEQLQPELSFEFPVRGAAPYGELPRRVWHSRDIRRMNRVPFGYPTILDQREVEGQVPQMEPPDGDFQDDMMDGEIRLVPPIETANGSSRRTARLQGVVHDATVGPSVPDGPPGVRR